MQTIASYHRLLLRQLKRAGITSDDIHELKHKNWNQFLASINKVYDDYDQERYLLDRSIEISTKELMDLNESLRREDIRLRSILDSAPDAMLIVQQDGRILMANNTVTTLLGYEKGDVIGVGIPTLIPELLDFPYYEKSNNLVELQINNKYGSKVDVEISHSSIKTGDNHFLLVVIRDISARKASEEEINQLNQKMLITSRQAGMADVAISVLHNVGNILNSINVSLVRMREFFPESNIHKLKPLSLAIIEYLNSNNLQGDKKGALISRYLSELSELIEKESRALFEEILHVMKQFEHIRDVVTLQMDIAGVSELRERVDISEIVDQAIHMIFTESDYKKICIKNNIIKNITFVTQKQKLLQVLINIIKNAKEAVIEKDSDNKEISISVSHEDDKSLLKIQIEDNGIGIKKNSIDSVFSMGFTTKSKGHGYGLHSSAIIVREIGGELSVDSKGENRGAVFTIKIPL